MKKKILSLAFLLLNTFWLFSQKLEVQLKRVGQAEQTVEIKRGRWIKHKEVRLANASTKLPLESIEYIIVEETYHLSKKVNYNVQKKLFNGDVKSSFIKDTTIMVERLVEGTVNLYAHLNAVDRVQFFVEKEESILPLEYYEAYTNLGYKEKKKYIGTLNFMMRDCPEVSMRKIESTSYHRNSLIKLVSRYNSDCGKQLQNAAPEKIGLFFGAQVTYSVLKTTPLNSPERVFFAGLPDGYTFLVSYPSLGLFMGIPVLKRHDRLRTAINVLYTPSMRIQYRQDQSDVGGSNITYDGELRVSLLETSLGVQYQFPFQKKDRGIYTRGGVIIQNILSYQQNSLTWRNNNSTTGQPDFSTQFIFEEHSSIDGNLFSTFGAGIFYQKWLLGVDAIMGNKFFSLNGREDMQRWRVSLQYFFSSKK
ncbi:MAG: hypothetical protein AAGG75_14380 [Bacteroidota bacterium]